MSTAKTAITYDKSGMKLGLGDVDGSLRTALDDIRDNIRLGLVGVSSDATHVGTLEEVLLAGTGISMATQNGGGDETRQISADALSGIDLSVTAGEGLSERDMVYLDESDGKWYQQDIDATAPVKMGRIRGCVIESGGITTDATGKVRILGQVSGFTGLTAGATIYGSSTAGSYTQTRPQATANGAQKIVSEMGYALSTTAIWVEPQQLSYHKRGTLANGGTLSLEHHAETETYEREPDVRVINSTSNGSLTSHSESNQESHYPIQGPVATTGTTSEPSFSSNTALGNNGGTTYILAQLLTTNNGFFAGFTLTIASSTGSPTGTITWEIQTDASGEPSGTVLQSGEFTPAVGSNSTLVPNGIFVPSSSNYWLVFKCTDAQSSGNYWLVSTHTGGTSSYGRSSDGGASWTTFSSFSLLYTWSRYGSASSSKLAQSFQIGGAANIGSIRLYLAKFGSPSGNLTASIYTDSSGPNTLVPNGASNTVAASSVGTSFGWIEFTFEIPPTLSSSTTYWIVLETTDSQSDANFVSWALEYDTPSYASGAMQRYDGSWNAMTADAIFDVVEADDVYYSQALLDDWGSALATYLARYDDGAGSNPTTQTTIKNNTGSEKTVELAVTFERGTA